MTRRKLSVGDWVAWDRSQGETVGRIQKKLTKPMTIKGYKVAASPENPEYLVKTENRGS